MTQPQVHPSPYGTQVGSYHTRKLAFNRLHAEVISAIQLGHDDAAAILVRLLVKLAQALPQ